MKISLIPSELWRGHKWWKSWWMDRWTNTQNFRGYNTIPSPLFVAGHKNPIRWHFIVWLRKQGLSFHTNCHKLGTLTCKLSVQVIPWFFLLFTPSISSRMYFLFLSVFFCLFFFFCCHSVPRKPSDFCLPSASLTSKWAMSWVNRVFMVIWTLKFQTN